jgi:hypothetical protein
MDDTNVAFRLSFVLLVFALNAATVSSGDDPIWNSLTLGNWNVELFFLDGVYPVFSSGDFFLLRVIVVDCNLPLFCVSLFLLDEMKQARAVELQRCKEASCSSSQDHVVKLQTSRIKQPIGVGRWFAETAKGGLSFRFAKKAEDCSRKLGSSLDEFANQSNDLVIELELGHEQKQEEWKSELERVKEECRKDAIIALLMLEQNHGMFVRHANERLEMVS